MNESRIEVISDDGKRRKDARTAHAEAKDPLGTLHIPDTCWLCYATALANKRAEEASQEFTG